MPVTLTATTINMNSGASVSDPSGNAPCFFARAWVNFNGTSGAVRGSLNVSSVTRSATGSYLVNFSTALSDGNYSVQTTAGGVAGVAYSYFSSTGATGQGTYTRSTTACRVFTGSNNSSLADTDNVDFVAFR